MAKFDQDDKMVCGTFSRLFRAFLRGCGGPQAGEATRLAVVENSPRLHTILQPRDAGLTFLEVIIALVIMATCGYRKNVIYFPLSFSPIAQCVTCFRR